jgi:hypothetical protein
MSVIQTASDAIRQFGTPVTWPYVGLAAVAAVGSWLAVIFNNRKLKASGNSKGSRPGEGKTCREHGEAISKFDEFRINAKESLGRIEGKIDRLVERL